jgi:type III pantothenate kinase
VVLLALDVGNTNITIGVFRDRAIVSQWRLSTSLHRTVDELGILLRQLCQWAHLSADDISGVVVGSVVPPLDGTLDAPRGPA